MKIWLPTVGTTKILHEKPESRFPEYFIPLRFVAGLEWGGTRIDKSFAHESKVIHLRNRRYIWKKHGRFIKEYS